MSPTLIKKYGNRRLYDTGESRYLTLDELAAKIRSGVDVRIVDAQSGEDLTQVTLTQLVLESGNASKFLPVQLLLQMIRLSDDALAEFFSRHVTGALEVYLQAKRLAQSNPLAMPGAATDAFARMWMASPFGAPFAPPPPGPPPARNVYHYTGEAPFVAPPPPPDDDLSSPPDAHERGGGDRGGPADGARSDVAAMRKELEELKQLVREGAAARAPKRKRRS